MWSLLTGLWIDLPMQCDTFDQLWALSRGWILIEQRAPVTMSTVCRMWHWSICQTSMHGYERHSMWFLCLTECDKKSRFLYEMFQKTIGRGEIRRRNRGEWRKMVKWHWCRWRTQKLELHGHNEKKCSSSSIIHLRLGNAMLASGGDVGCGYCLSHHAYHPCLFIEKRSGILLCSYAGGTNGSGEPMCPWSDENGREERQTVGQCQGESDGEMDAGLSLWSTTVYHIPYIVHSSHRVTLYLSLYPGTLYVIKGFDLLPYTICRILSILVIVWLSVPVHYT